MFDLEAAQFCSVNWTYARDYRRILGIEDPASFPIDRCSACSFVYARYLPHSEFLRRLYDEVIRFDDCRVGSENDGSYASRLRYLTVLLGLAAAHETPARTALDFGAGLGVTLRLLEACGIEAWGVDPSESRSAYAAQRQVKIVPTLSDVPSTSSFDLLICDNVLEHLPEPTRTIHTLSSLVTSGALAFVSVPDYGMAKLKAQQEALVRGRPIDMTLNPWEHLNYFRLQDLDCLLAVGGFERISAKDLPMSVDVGLRPQSSRRGRILNGVATAKRLCRYVLTGQGVETPEFAFYRKTTS